VSKGTIRSGTNYCVLKLLGTFVNISPLSFPCSKEDDRMAIRVIGDFTLFLYNERILGLAWPAKQTLKDDTMKEKQMSLEEGAGLIKNGHLLGLTIAVLDDAPMAFLRELVRRDVKDLRVATLSGGGLNADFLIGAGVVSKYETCHCSLGEYGQAPNFQKAIRSGAIKLEDNT
jgi:hypothetical protein